MSTPFQSGLEQVEREAITITALVMRSHSDSSLPFLKSNITGKGSSLEAADPFRCRSNRAYVYLSVLRPLTVLKKIPKHFLVNFRGTEKKKVTETAVSRCP